MMICGTRGLEHGGVDIVAQALAGERTIMQHIQASPSSCHSYYSLVGVERLRVVLRSMLTRILASHSSIRLNNSSSSTQGRQIETEAHGLAGRPQTAGANVVSPATAAPDKANGPSRNHESEGAAAASVASVEDVSAEALGSVWFDTRNGRWKSRSTKSDESSSRKGGGGVACFVREWIYRPSRQPPRPI
eukprot:GHVU01235121.1.p1 GENE.GHVU01235121.1~~GHVU01235121.1.p1  ORF type:complete len:190 (-),score=30.79 GHVU01235121.1:268-837(-)